MFEIEGEVSAIGSRERGEPALRFLVMKRRFGLASAAAAVFAMTLPSLAHSAAQPTSPLAGARTSSHPTFTWTLPANEEADSLSVASRPDTTPNGEFFRESVVATGFLGEGRPQTQWTSASALFAGSYWWNVETHDRSTYAPMFSQLPVPFTVRAETRMIRVQITRNSYSFFADDLDIDVRWATNAREVVAEVAVMRGRRRVGRVRERHETLLPLDPDSASLTWERPRTVRTGTRLTLIVSVRGGGQAVAWRRVVRAP
jgi:hypothetical protein